MKKAISFILFFLGLTLNAQTFNTEKFNKPIDLIKITSIKKRILGIETIEYFEVNKDSVLAKYNRKTYGDEFLCYEVHNNKYWPEESYVNFYIYDFQTKGKLDSTFNLSDGTYTFEFYSNVKIVKCFLGKKKK